jgi:hypothetical protein
MDALPVNRFGYFVILRKRIRSSFREIPGLFAERQTTFGGGVVPLAL